MAGTSRALRTRTPRRRTPSARRAARCARDVPAPGGALDRDVAPVEIDDLLHDRHAEPGARGLGGEEGQEDLVPILGHDAHPVVHHLHRHAGRPSPSRLTSTRPPARARTDRFQRVLRSRWRTPAGASARRADHDRLAVDAAVADADAACAPSATADSTTGSEDAQRARTPPRSRRVSRVKSSRLVMMRLDLGDAGQDRARPSPARAGSPSDLARRQQARGHLDAAERVADLVGHAGRHLAERGELLALDEPPLGLHLLGEVAQHARPCPSAARCGVEDAARSARCAGKRLPLTA